jgi:DNA gyrase subunit A
LKNNNIKQFTRIKEKKMENKIFITATDGYCDLIVWTSFGKVIRFNETEVRISDRKAKGVKAFRLEENEKVTGIISVKKLTGIQDYTIAVVDEEGNVKRMTINNLPITNRAGKGIKI